MNGPIIVERRQGMEEAIFKEWTIAVISHLFMISRQGPKYQKMGKVSAR